MAETEEFTKEDKEDAVEKCIRETGVSMETLRALNATDSFYEKAQENPILKTFFFCVTYNHGWIYLKDGEVDLDKVKDTLMQIVVAYTEPDPIFQKTIEKCVVKKPTVEDTALEIFHCILITFTEEG